MSRKSGASTPDLEVRETPQELADACVRLVVHGMPVVPGHFDQRPRILEPSSGLTAPFVRACRAEMPSALIHSVDIRAGLTEANIAAGADEHFEDNTVEFAQEKEHEIREVVRAMRERARTGYDMIIGNPPFSHAHQHIEALLPLLNPGGFLAFILRINVFGGKKVRGKFWDANPERTFYPIRPRPSFGKSAKTGKNGTDGTEYALFVWGSLKMAAPGPRGGFLDWEKKKRAKKAKSA